MYQAQWTILLNPLRNLFSDEVQSFQKCLAV